jgi:serine/threonine-protein kinase
VAGDDRGVVVERVRGREVVFLRFSGRIDERFDEKAVVIDGPSAIELSGVRAITSVGVRNFSTMLKRAARSGPSYLVDCPPCIVDQLNVVRGFAGGSEVLSARAFFACDCGIEEERLIDVLSEGPRIRAGQPPEARCGRCGAEMRLVEDDSFRFVSSCGARRLDLRVRATLLDLGLYSAIALEDRPLAVHKVVEGADVALRLEGAISGRSRLERVAEDDGIVVLLLGGLIMRAEGTESFSRFLVAQRERAKELILVDVPPQLVGLFATGALPLERTKVDSLLMPVRCDECAELALTTIRLHEAESVSRCPRCGRPAQLVGASQGREAMRVNGPPSPEAHALLARVDRLYSQALSDARLVGRTAASGAAAADLPGQIGGYRILRPLSAGGMAEVLLASRESLGGVEKVVALKRFRRELFQAAPAAIAMFLAEARLAAQLSHPNIVQIFDVGENDGDLYMAMEYVDGRDLRELVDRGRPMPPHIVAHVALEVARALAYLHDARDLRGRPLQIVHRDVSPQNVLVDKSGRVVLIDFGVALAGEGELQKRRRKVAGNLAYMSPEQCYGEPLDGRSDLFSLGVTMWEMLAGDALFRREDTNDTREALLKSNIPRLPGVPPRLESLVMRLLSRDRDDRPASAHEVARELDEMLPKLGGRMTPAELGTFVVRSLDPRRQSRARPRGIEPASEAAIATRARWPYVLGVAALATMSLLFAWQMLRR